MTSEEHAFEHGRLLGRMEMMSAMIDHQLEQLKSTIDKISEKPSAGPDSEAAR